MHDLIKYSHFLSFYNDIHDMNPELFDDLLLKIDKTGYDEIRIWCTAMSPYFKDLGDKEAQKIIEITNKKQVTTEGFLDEVCFLFDVKLTELGRVMVDYERL